jgi:hypothetical protein
VIHLDWTSFIVGMTFSAVVIGAAVLLFLAYAVGLATSDDGR